MLNKILSIIVFFKIINMENPCYATDVEYYSLSHIYCPPKFLNVPLSTYYIYRPRKCRHAKMPTHTQSMFYISKPLKCRHADMPTCLHIPPHLSYIYRLLTCIHADIPTCLPTCREFFGVVIFNVI